MSEWKEVILSEITSKIGDGLHGTPIYDEHGDYFFINGNNLIDGKIQIKPDTKRVNFEEYQKHAKPISDRTILLSINGTIGNLALYKDEKCMLGKSACYLNLLHDVDTKFIYYTFLSNDFQSYIREVATGTTIPNVPLKGIREYSFKLPSLTEQKAIASILSSLDDKIDLLHRQNATLEKMAETLFRQWFVEEAEEWKEGVLGDVVELIYGKGLKEDIRTGTGFPVVGSSGIVGYHSEYLAEGPGIVIGRKGTLGKVIYLFDNFFPIDTTYFIKSKSESVGLFYEYFLLKTMNFEEMNSDSAVPGLNRDIALSTEIKLPSEKRINEFNEYCSSLFNKIKTNQTQIRTLTTLRDTLLPKLMSGEVRVAADKN